MKTDWFVREEFREHLRGFNWDNYIDSAFDTMVFSVICVAHMEYFAEEYYDGPPLAYERLRLIAGAYCRLFEQLAEVYKEILPDSTSSMVG